MATVEELEQLASHVLARLDQVQTVDPLARDFARLSLEDAYRVQCALVSQRCRRGERIVGRKVAFSRIGSVGARFA